MRKWEYMKIWREMDLTGVDLLELGPMGPGFLWKDILDETDVTRYSDELGRLEKLSEDGWELVSVVYEHENRVFEYTYYLKRAVED